MAEFARLDSLLLPFAIARVLRVGHLPERGVVREIRAARHVGGLEQPVVDDAHALRPGREHQV